MLGRDGLSNGLINIGVLFCTGLKPNDGPNEVGMEIDRVCLELQITFTLDGVEVFTRRDGKRAAKIYAAPAVCQRLLRAWKDMFIEYKKKLNGAAGVVEKPSHLNLTVDKTKAGQAEYNRLKPIHARLAAQGLHPSWVNGLELYYKPDGNRSSPSVPYEEQADPAAGGGSSTTPARPAAPTGPKRQAVTPPSTLRTGVSGTDGKSRQKGDGDVGDQGME